MASEMFTWLHIKSHSRRPFHSCNLHKPLSVLLADVFYTVLPQGPPQIAFALISSSEKRMIVAEGKKFNFQRFLKSPGTKQKIWLPGYLLPASLSMQLENMRKKGRSLLFLHANQANLLRGKLSLSQQAV